MDKKDKNKNITIVINAADMQRSNYNPVFNHWSNIIKAIKNLLSKSKELLRICKKCVI